MKVKPTGEMPGAARQPAQPFKKLLDEARAAKPAKSSWPSVKPALPMKAHSTALAPPGSVVRQARVRVEAEAARLTQVRADHQVHAREATEQRRATTDVDREAVTERVVDQICKDLLAEPPAPRPVHAAPVHPAPPVPGPAKGEPSTEPGSRAQQAVALIEKIVVFVKSHRPALALTLNNSLGAEVEIERLGPREVAVKFISHKGPPSPDTLTRIREEMRARGLHVAALSVA